MIHLSECVYISHQMTRMHLGFELKANTILRLKKFTKSEESFTKKEMVPLGNAHFILVQFQKDGIE